MRVCKICFNEIAQNGIGSIVNRKICQRCFNEFNVIMVKEKIDDVEVMSIYEYNDFLKKIIYQFKACFDIELSEIFLSKLYLKIKLMYKDYLIVPVPSNIEDDNKRGFNHVVEIFKQLNLNIYPCLFKKIKFKQSDLSKKERLKVGNKFGIINGKILKNKKVLIVDDVITSGSSMKECIKIIREYGPYCIKGLVLCKKMSKK